MFFSFSEKHISSFRLTSSTIMLLSSNKITHKRQKDIVEIYLINLKVESMPFISGIFLELPPNSTVRDVSGF